MKGLKQKIKNGETVLGCWLNLGSPVTAEIVGLAGFDWVLVDLEHGAGGEKEVLHQLQALEHTPAAAIIRVEGHARQRFHRVLDLGAEGIMCPRVNNLEEAKMAAGALRYTPTGTRGVAKMVRATGFGVNFNEYVANSAENILGVIQVESVEMLGCLEEVAKLEAVDVLFIGPADLSMALGIFGQFDHPKFTEAVELTVNAAQKAGKATGILLSNPKDFDKYHQMGIRMIACGADATFVSEGARNLVGEMRGSRERLG